MRDESSAVKPVAVANGGRVVIRSDTDIVAARQLGRVMATQLGFASSDATLVSMAISELARNIVRYAKNGDITIRSSNANGRVAIEVVAHDEGPGIPNVKQAMQDGYSTSGGLGLGLPGVKRLMDEFEIASEVGQGTTVSVRKWKT